MIGLPNGRIWSTTAAGKLPILASAVVLLVLIGGLTWLMLGPPSGFPGFVRDTATAEALRRVELYANALGRSPSELSARAYVWSVRGLLVALFTLHGLAILAVRRWPKHWALWIGTSVIALVVALVYPPTSADVFYYAISGHMVADLGANPYQLPPATFAANPLLPFNFWTGITSPYGPVWTTVSAAVVTLIGPDPLRISLAFKILAAAAALAYALIAARLAEWVRTGSGPVAFVLVAWHPLLIIESAGTAHHDAVVMTLALLGLLALARRRPRSALVLVTLATATKLVVLPLVALIALARLGQRPWSRVASAWVIDALAVGGVVIAVSMPYWAAGAMLRSTLVEPARLFVNPMYTLPANAIASRWGGAAGEVFRDGARVAAQVAVVGVVLASGIWLGYRVWRDRPVLATMLRLQLRAWVAVTVALSLLPANAHPWYAIWSLGPVVALSGGRGRLLAAYLAFVGFFFIAYHTTVTPDAPPG